MHTNINIDLSKFTIDYNKKNRLGKGGYGQVFKAINNEDGKEYAAKIFYGYWYDNEILDREVLLMLCSNHPTILQVIGYSITDDELTIIMPLAKKGSLRSILKMILNNKTPEDYTNTNRQIILIGVARGIKYLHDHTIIHRDIKPDNVLLDEDYQPMISDFGLAKHFDIENSLEQSRYTGTNIYMCPEIIARIQYDRKADVYAFGILMNEVISELDVYKPLRPIADNRDKIEFYLQKEVVVNRKRPEMKENIKDSLKKLINQCWSHDPNDRPSFNEIFNKLTSREYFLDDVDVDKIEEYVTKITKDKDNIEYLLQKIDELRIKTEEMTEEIRTIKDEKEHLKKENLQLKKEIEQENTDQTKKDNDKLITELDQIKTEKSNLQKEKDQMKKDNDELIAELNKIKIEKSNLQKEKDQMKKDNDELIAELNKIKIEKSNLQKEKDQIKNDNDELIAELNKIKTEKSNLQKEKDQIKNDNDKQFSTLIHQQTRENDKTELNKREEHKEEQKEKEEHEEEQKEKEEHEEEQNKGGEQRKDKTDKFNFANIEIETKSIIVCGSNQCNQLGKESNNKNQHDAPIIFPLQKLHISPTSLRSFSVYSDHSVLINSSAILQGIGCNNNGQISSTLSKSQLNIFTEFSIKEEKLIKDFNPVSVVCTDYGTLYMFSKKKYQTSRLL